MKTQARVMTGRFLDDSMRRSHPRPESLVGLVIWFVALAILLLGLHSIGLVAPETLLDVPTIPEPFVSMESPDLAAPTRLAGLAPCSDQMFIC
ncbi:MAG: hypothetical protein HY217_08795 [Candidatus Rokubacteria bacterium]|nr:hypothetical protein [Candidatus Rokubacteria bacterium]